MRRVREERSGGAVAAQSAQSVKDDSGKSDFIAAARRAAKAAAADATVVTREEKKKKTKGGSSIGSMLSTRRKPLLMGAGAILLALLAVPLIRGFVAPSDSPDQASLQNANPIVEDVTTAALPNTEGAVDDLELTVEEPIVENVEDAPVQANIADPMTPATIGVNEIEQPDALTLDSVPEEVGPITLREAAISGDAKALYLVGDYYTGGVPGQSGADLAKALEWYTKSADLGYAPAQYRVGNFYEKAMGTERDLMAAKTWYQLAAEQGNAAAMHNLAVLFANGPDGTPDFESATRWFKSAAELGVKDSQFNLGILSAQGRGVPQDLAESYKWRSRLPVAKRDEVADALRPDQLETARGATELWKAKELVESVNYVDIPDDWRTDAAATAATSKKAPQVDKAQMKKAIRNIQAILNNSGYDAGPVDGVMGGKTKTAIKAFQKANGMEPNGNVDQALVQKLIALNEKNKKS
ncbi:Localization factor PodJL [Nymphon striatum]|nr:Localization factor PodJL [Nymphon striatum]